MTCNVGGVERAIRIVLGLVFVALGAFGGLPSAVAGFAYLFAAIALVTGAIGFCPAWKLLGINTCAPSNR